MSQHKAGFVFLFLLTFISTGYAVNGDDISELRMIIQAQQAKLSAQAKKLENEQAMLHRLAAQVNALSVQQQTEKTKKSNFISAPTTKFSDDSVLRQASAPGDIVSITPQVNVILGSKKSNTSISGQISAVGFQANDGRFNQLYFGTNSVSNSRLNINSIIHASPSLAAGSRIQFGFNTNPSNAVTQFTDSNTIDIRRAEVYLKSDQWGVLDFGQGETASCYTSHVDLSGTQLAGRSSVQDIGGGLYFDGISTNPQVNDAFDSLDGFTRKVRVRYDTPSFHGFLLSGSVITRNRNDIALKFGNKFGGTKVAAEVAYTSPQGVSSGSNLAYGNEADGSLSALLPINISLTGAAGEIIAENSMRKNPNYYYIKPGYQFNYFHAGLTALSVDYGKYNNFAQNNDLATAEGLQAVQNFDKLDLAAYVGYRHFALNRPGANFNNINLWLFGALYKFS